MAYEIFTRKVARRGTPMLTITKLGRLSLNKTATVILEKQAIEFVLVLWDNEGRKIGIRPITKRDNRAYTLAYGKKGNGAGFSAKTFLDYINYDYSQSRSFPTEWNTSEGVFETEIPVEHLLDQRQQTLLPVTMGKKQPKAG